MKKLTIVLVLALVFGSFTNVFAQTTQTLTREQLAAQRDRRPADVAPADSTEDAPVNDEADPEVEAEVAPVQSGTQTHSRSELEAIRDGEEAETSSTGDTTVNTDHMFLFDIGAYYRNTFTRGREADEEVWGVFASGTYRYHVGTFELDRPVRFGVGLHLQGGFSGFEGEHSTIFEGEGGEIAGGLELTFQDTFAGGSLARWSLEMKFLPGFARSYGSTSDGAYRTEIETTFVKLSGNLNILWPFEPESDGLYSNAANHRICNVHGVDVGVTEGWLPKIEIRWDWKIPVHISKRSTVTRQGGHDRAYENYLHLETRIHAYRWATDTINTRERALWEGSVGAIVGLNWRRSSGMVDMMDGHSVYEWEFGVFGEVMYNRSIGASLYIKATRQFPENNDFVIGLDVFTIHF